MDSFKPNTLDDETLLSVGLVVLQEILTRRLQTGAAAPAKKKVVKAPAKKAQAALVISEDELSHDLLNAIVVDELTADSYESPVPTPQAATAPAAPKKAKKTPAKSKQAAANAMFQLDEDRSGVVEECD